MTNRGDPFERLIAQIQRNIDPSATVLHNQFLIDRLGHRRQFDVVITGSFAGQTILGVIECKDLNRMVGTPEVDAFNTKAQDVNANFKIIASKRGFSKPALHKSKHYGIRAISLLDPKVLAGQIKIGDWWISKVLRWNQISIQAHPQDPALAITQASPDQIFVRTGRVLDWFTNHLAKVGHKESKTGWVVNFELVFDPPIAVSIEPGGEFVCQAISFHAERQCLEYERFVPLSADAFVDWHTKSATIPANTKVSMGEVPMDFRQWAPRDLSRTRESSFLPMTIEAHEHEFDISENAPDLESM